MKHTFHVFPAGLTGAGLLLLRISVALPLIALPDGHSFLTWQVIGLNLVAVALTLGLATSFAAIVTLGSVALMLLWTEPSLPLPFFAHVLDSLALAIVGPGAYSVDAKLFGRRTVRLEQ